jgi:MerR family transcriptional regulator, redox-sensitive transcriptional activator SoxR
MKIGQLAQLAGVNPSAIRYYERMGILTGPDRVGGQRRYPAETIYRVLLIRFAADMGFTLPEIRIFLKGLRSDAPVGARWRNLARRKISEVEQTIERSRQLKSLLERMLECRCASLEICVKCLRLSPRMKLVSSNRNRKKRNRALVSAMKV